MLFLSFILLLLFDSTGTISSPPQTAKRAFSANFLFGARRTELKNLVEARGD